MIHSGKNQTQVLKGINALHSSGDLRKMFHFGFNVAIVIVVVNFSFSSAAVGDSDKVRSNEVCVTPTGDRGICKNINKCEPLLALLIKGKSRPQPSVIDFLIRSHCGFEGKDSVVCCPVAVRPKDSRANENATFKKQTLERFLNKSCGSIQTLDKVVGGSATALHEFPWIALIGYKTRFGLKYRCGGSLISSRYVLTAAHCVTTLKDIYPTSVRLGEHDLDSSQDSDPSSPPPKDLPIEELIPHPDYFKPELRNDIALIRLAKRVEFTDHIRPICLPLNKDLNERGLLEEKAVVAGWGTTESGTSANVLRKITLPIIPLNECSKIYKRKVPITEAQICAGGEAGKDSCSGDSGSPLQVIGVNPLGQPAYIQQGIVSFGPRICGTQGMPGVYTRVAHYVDWISKNLNE